jgi:predicted HAD superfamily Cof-like phosphohydrolase
MNHQESVKEFTLAFDMFYTPIGGYTKQLVIDNKKVSKLRYDLIHEEVHELFDAIDTNDFIEIIDALSDILYVVYGAGVSFGLDLYTSFPKYLVNRNIIDTYDKKDTHFEMVLGNHQSKESLTIKKNEFTEAYYISHMKLVCDSMKQGLDTLSMCLIDFKVLDDLEHHLNYMLFSVYNMGKCLHIDLDKSFQIVQDSNMSKVCQSLNDAERTVEWYQTKETRYDSPKYYLRENGTYIVRNESSGKALKCIDYIPAKFTSLLT